MRKTFAWSCVSCGEYNVVDLGETGTHAPHCEFCLRTVQAAPSLEEKPAARLSDEWLGDDAVRPIFRPASDGDRR